MSRVAIGNRAGCGEEQLSVPPSTGRGAYITEALLEKHSAGFGGNQHWRRTKILVVVRSANSFPIRSSSGQRMAHLEFGQDRLAHRIRLKPVVGEASYKVRWASESRASYRRATH